MLSSRVPASPEVSHSRTASSSSSPPTTSARTSAPWCGRSWPRATAIDVWVADDGSPDGTGAAVRGADGRVPGPGGAPGPRSRRAAAGRPCSPRSGRASPTRAATRSSSRWTPTSPTTRGRSRSSWRSSRPATWSSARATSRAAAPRSGACSRPLLSWAPTSTSRLVAGVPVRDTTSRLPRATGGRSWRPTDFDRIKIKGYAVHGEMAYQAWIAGFRLGEVPIHFKNRARDASKLTSQEIYMAFLNFALLRLRYGFRPGAGEPGRTPMKVLMVTSSYPKFPGDVAAPFIEEIARGVAARGHRGGRGAARTTPTCGGGRTSRCASFPIATRPATPGASGATPRASRPTCGCARGVYLLAPLVAPGPARAPCPPASSPSATTSCTPTGWCRTRRWSQDIARAHRVPLVVSLHGSDVFLAERLLPARVLARRDPARARGRSPRAAATSRDARPAPGRRPGAHPRSCPTASTFSAFAPREATAAGPRRAWASPEGRPLRAGPRPAGGEEGLRRPRRRGRARSRASTS